MTASLVVVYVIQNPPDLHKLFVRYNTAAHVVNSTSITFYLTIHVTVTYFDIER